MDEVRDLGWVGGKLALCCPGSFQMLNPVALYYGNRWKIVMLTIDTRSEVQRYFKRRPSLERYEILKACSTR